MQKVEHPTDFVLIKADNDSSWDGCSFAIIYLSAKWKTQLQDRAALLGAFLGDSDFYCLTYWDCNVDFFASTGGEDPQLAEELLEEDETWSYVETSEEELKGFERPENKVRAYQLKIIHDRYACFQAWGEHTGEKFYTENFKIDDLV